MPNDSASPEPPDTKRLDILDLADQCVKCGLCIEHCPTYRHQRNEADSPRGRIALIQGWISGQIPHNKRLGAHLDGCLECRACETACPSLVRFATIMDGARAYREQTRSPIVRRAKLIRLRALASPSLAHMMAGLSALYRRLGLHRVAAGLGIQRSPLLNAYHRLTLGFVSTRGTPAIQTPGQPDVDLYLGCVSRTTQGSTLEAAHRVLMQLKLQVRICAEQTCCGAMLRHNGFPGQADEQLSRNAGAFGDRPILGIASACIAELRSHPKLRGAQELCDFLADHVGFDAVRLQPLPGDAWVHEPCSHRNQLGGNSAVFRLLQRIPELRVAPLSDNAFCCGAAGTYLISQPVLSAALLGDKIAHLRANPRRFLVTTNTGCALQLASGIREAGLDIEVCHPVDLIARQLRAPNVSRDQI